MVIVMFGTNDTKSYFHRTPYEIANGMGKLAGQILTSAYGVGTVYPAPKLLIVCPPPLVPMPHVWFQGMFERGREKTWDLPKYYAALAHFLHADFLDAGDFTDTDGVDGIHFTAENNAALGKAIAGKAAEIFARNGQ